MSSTFTGILLLLVPVIVIGSTLDQLLEATGGGAVYRGSGNSFIPRQAYGESTSGYYSPAFNKFIQPNAFGNGFYPQPPLNNFAASNSIGSFPIRPNVPKQPQQMVDRMTCLDTHVNCQLWADECRCYSDGPFMRATCGKACSVCEFSHLSRCPLDRVRIFNGY